MGMTFCAFFSYYFFKQNMEFIYIYNDYNLFDSTLNHIGTLDDEIGSNSLYIYSQKI